MAIIFIISHPFSHTHTHTHSPSTRKYVTTTFAYFLPFSVQQAAVLPGERWFNGKLQFMLSQRGNLYTFE